MRKTSLLKVLLAGFASFTLMCAPQSVFAQHGGGVLTAAAVAAPMAVAALVSEAPTGARVVTAAALVPIAGIAVAKGRDTGPAAGTAGWAERCQRRVVLARAGVRRHWLALTLRRDGTRSDDPRAPAKPAGASKWREPMVRGTPLVADGVPWERARPPASEATES